MNSDSIPLLRKRQNNKDSAEERFNRRNYFFFSSRENMDPQSAQAANRKYVIIYGIATGLGVIILTIVLAWLLKYEEGFGFSTAGEYFCWHPLLMVFGMVFCYSQSMLIFRTGRKVLKNKLKLVHMTVNMTALVVSILGVVAAFASHAVRHPPTPDLYTLHSWIGLTTVILFGIQFIIGFTGFLFPGYSPARRALILPIHVAIGTAIFVFAIVAAITGVAEKTIFTLGRTYQDLPNAGVLLNVIGYLIVIFGALILYLVNAHEYKRVPLAED
ncbi:hypothetical protein Trydic_g10143 [Trypoxylus dichotomus]